MHYELLKKLLFTLPPEDAHHFTLTMAAHFPQLGSCFGTGPLEELQVSVGNVKWHSPIGLAAGLDKDAVALEFFKNVGFGSVECGTITVKPQAGNPKPRIFRYLSEASLRNSMGFPNQGMKSCLKKLQARPENFPLGVNIGKSKNANPHEAIDEYLELYENLAPHADWVTINISSPNTPGLRDLQNREWLTSLMQSLAPLRARLQKPLWIKLSPDMEDSDLKALTRTLSELHPDGLIATNTTHMPERGVGGVSGALLKTRARHKRELILSNTELEVIGVGGIDSFRDLLQWWKAGGKAVQLYTAFIYQGPGLLQSLALDMLSFLESRDLHSLDEFFSLSRAERHRLIGA